MNQPTTAKGVHQTFWKAIRFTKYVLLVVPIFTLTGLVFGCAFHSEFTIENKSQVTVNVTPVGTVGEGVRRPLPVHFSRFPIIPSSRRGGFKLNPGESIEIAYDMDDINFSEIVVYDEDHELGQLVVNADPMRNQYHAPLETHFIIDDPKLLVEVPHSVSYAAREAQAKTISPWIFLSLLIGPWIVLLIIVAAEKARKGNVSERNPDRN